MTMASQLRGSVAKAAAAAAATGTGNGVGGHNFVYDLIVIGGGRCVVSPSSGGSVGWYWGIRGRNVIGPP